MQKIQYKNNSQLITSIIFLIIGIILFTNPGGIVKFISTIIGSILIIIGIYNLLSYNKALKNLNIEIKSKLVSGIILIILGTISIVCRGAIENVLRFILGGWVIYSGVLRLIDAVNYKNNDNFIIRLIISIFMIIFGLYIVLKTNLIFSMIGLCIIIYSIIEILNFIFYRKK